MGCDAALHALRAALHMDLNAADVQCGRLFVAGAARVAVWFRLC
jgi:hypothetical protein